MYDATWDDVYQACCVHSTEEWGWVFIGILLVIFLLYWFLFSLELLGSSAKVLTGCRAGALFGDDTNPVAGVMVGIIGTVLLQSSSTTTSIVISLTGSVITLEQGIYMIMGSNIGTVSVSST
jgi:solute carrier family 34 (sodium-dependent phosphate cotransporter)